MLHRPQLNQRAIALRKVPEITAMFWFIKILTTAMGEVFSDFLVLHLSPVIAVALGSIGLGIALALQFGVRTYVPWRYWLVVVMVAIFGTMAADVVHTGFGISYLVSTIVFSIAIAVLFGVWYTSEKTLSIHSITNPKRELLYWATVIATFALGTAAGDMTAATMHLGYVVSGVLFAVLIALPVLGYWFFGLNAILAFWIAYILTRPLGASFADWAGKESTGGGLGLGRGPVSLVLTILIIACVGYITITRKDSTSERLHPEVQTE